MLSDAKESRKMRTTDKEIANFAVPLHADKDKGHDFSHIRRIVTKSLEIAERHPCDTESLRLAANLHGITMAYRTEISEFLSSHSYSQQQIEKIRSIALEYLDKSLKTTEGKIIFDAHLIEGGKTFHVMKSLAIDLSSGRTIAQSIKSLEKWSFSQECCFSENQPVFDEYRAYALTFLEDVKRDMGDSADFEAHVV